MVKLVDSAHWGRRIDFQSESLSLSLSFSGWCVSCNGASSQAAEKLVISIESCWFFSLWLSERPKSSCPLVCAFGIRWNLNLSLAKKQVTPQIALDSGILSSSSCAFSSWDTRDVQCTKQTDIPKTNPECLQEPIMRLPFILPTGATCQTNGWRRMMKRAARHQEYQQISILMFEDNFWGKKLSNKRTKWTQFNTNSV